MHWFYIKHDVVYNLLLPVFLLTILKGKFSTPHPLSSSSNFSSSSSSAYFWDQLMYLERHQMTARTTKAHRHAITAETGHRLDRCASHAADHVTLAALVYLHIIMPWYCCSLCVYKVTLLRSWFSRCSCSQQKMAAGDTWFQKLSKPVHAAPPSCVTSGFCCLVSACMCVCVCVWMVAYVWMGGYLRFREKTK